MRAPAALASALVLAALAGGCVSVSWTRDRRHDPPPEGAIGALEPGRSTLADALAALGAPLYVWEHAGSGAALAWGWADDERKGISISYQVQELTSASFSYDAGTESMRGALLLFDDRLVLVRVREGSLVDLEGEARRRRPAPVPAGDPPG